MSAFAPVSPADVDSAHAAATSRAETHCALQKPPEASSCPVTCPENVTARCTLVERAFLPSLCLPVLPFPSHQYSLFILLLASCFYRCAP